MKVVIFATLFVFVSAKQFVVPDTLNPGKFCAMIDLEGQLSIKAMNGKQKLADMNLPFADASLVESDCQSIKLRMNNSIQVWFKKQNATGAVQNVQPIAAFKPVDVVPTTNDSQSITFAAKEFGSFASNESFKCVSPLQHVFTTTNNYSIKYEVTATTNHLQIQFGDIKNNSFNAGQECPQDAPVTTVTPKTTVTPTTPAPSDEPLHLNVTDKTKNITCILLEGDFVLTLVHENQTVSVKVPSTATATGNCSLNATESMIEVSFDKDMAILMYFAKSPKDFTYVNEMKILYSTSIFKGVQPENKTVDVKPKPAADFLKATSEGYYQCNSNTTLIDGSNVTLTSSNLKYKAFNDKATIDFDGAVSQCPADEETSSVVPIAVGAALAGLVVIVLIAYLIGRRRSRKSGYESV